MGLVVCALDISICVVDGDGSVHSFIHLRPRSISLFFSTFVRSSASNPIDIGPSARFCFWVTLAGMLRIFLVVCIPLRFYVTHIHIHDQPLSPVDSLSSPFPDLV